MEILAILDLVFCTVGFNRFAEDVAMMIGKKPNILFRICWMVITPAGLFVSIRVISDPQKIVTNCYHCYQLRSQDCLLEVTLVAQGTGFTKRITNLTFISGGKSHLCICID